MVGEGDGTPLQYSCLENPMDGGAWLATVHGVAKSWTRAPQLEETPETPPSSRAEGLLLLHDHSILVTI